MRRCVQAAQDFPRLVQHGHGLASGVGRSTFLRQGPSEANAHVGVVRVELEPLAEQGLGAIEVAAGEFRHRVVYAAAQGVGRSVGGIEMERGLHRALDGGQEEERTHHALGLPPAARVGAVPELRRGALRGQLDGALGDLPAAIIGLHLLLRCLRPHVAVHEADLREG